MITKLNKNSEILKRCENNGNCKKCKIADEFECVASLVRSYMAYCCDILEEAIEKRQK